MKDLTARRVRTGVVNTAFNLTANGKCMNCLRSVQRGSSRDAFRCKPRTGCRWCGRVTAALSQRHDGSFLRRRLVSGLAGESGAHMHGSLVGVRFGLEYPVHLQALGCAPSCVVTNRTAPAKQWLNKWLYDRNEMKGKKRKVANTDSRGPLGSGPPGRGSDTADPQGPGCLWRRRAIRSQNWW